MTKQQVGNEMLRDFPWDGTELAAPLTLPGALLAPTYLEQKEIATPANPPAGSLRFYPKSDGKYYQLDSAGTESIISGTTKAQTDSWYLPLSGGTLTGSLTVQGSITALDITGSRVSSASDVVAGGSYRWGSGDPEVLYREMPGRLRLAGAQLTIDSNLNVGSYTQLAEIASPVTPNTGQMRLYAKADHNLYIKDTSGSEASLLTFTQADARYDPLGIASSGDAAHIAATDPHPVYLTAAEGDVRYSSNPGGPSGGYLTVASAAATYLPLVGGTLTGNLVFSGVGRRIQGDFTGSPASVRTLFQTSVANGLTSVGIIPNGTGTVGEFAVYGASNPDNTSRFQIGMDSSSAWLSAWRTGTGTPLPLVIYTNNVERIRVAVDGTLTYSGGIDILADFSSSQASRTFFKTSVANGVTAVSAMPNGTGGVSTFRVYSDSVLTNATYGEIWADTTIVRINSAAEGTGVALPIAFYIGGVEKMRIAANGTITNPSVTIAGVGSAGFVGGLRNGDFGIGARTANFMRIGANSTIAFWANDGAFTDDAPQMSLNSAGALTVGGSVSTGGLTATSLNVTGGATVNSTTNIVATNGYGVAAAAGGIAPFMIQAGGPSQGGGASMICFHRPGAFATYFGLDNDNVLRYGGWSMGAVAYRVIFGDGYGNPGGITVTSGIIQMSNCDIQQVRTLYGMSNGCYFTSSGSDTWSCLNHLSIGYDLTVGRTLTATGGNSTFSYVISNGGMDCNGNLYFNHNGGIYISNNNSQFILSQAPISTNGYYYFVNTTVAFYWNGSGLQNSNGAIYSAGFVATGTGTYNFGDSNVRISRPGNIMYFYAYDAQWAFIRTTDSFNCGYVDGGGFHNTSKKKYKQDILPIQDGLRIVTDQRVTPIRYAIKGKDPIPAIGFTAEDMSQVVPEVVGYDDEGPASINYSSLVAVLWDAVRTLNKRIEVLEKTA